MRFSLCNQLLIDAMPPIIKNLKITISTSHWQTRHGNTARDGPLALGSIIIRLEHHDASNPKLVVLPPTSFFLSTITVPSPEAGPQLR
jgi:hypothetical protein